MQYPPIICSGGLMMKILGRKHICKGIVDMHCITVYNIYIMILIINEPI